MLCEEMSMLELEAEAERGSLKQKMIEKPSLRTQGYKATQYGLVMLEKSMSNWPRRNRNDTAYSKLEEPQHG
jgi:hypothetical protein